MRPTFTLEEIEYGRALKEYMEATGKDAAYCTNRQALNVAIKTANNTPLGDKSKIRDLANKVWWPKYVAKRIKGSEKGIRVGKQKGQRKYVKGTYTVKEARAVSKRLIRNRERRVGFIRSGWNPAIKELSALKLKTRGIMPAGTRNIKKPKGEVRIAKPGINPVATIINHSKGAEVVGAEALKNGIALATADMRGFIADKFGDTAKKFNGKKH